MQNLPQLFTTPSIFCTDIQVNILGGFARVTFIEMYKFGPIEATAEAVEYLRGSVTLPVEKLIEFSKTLNELVGRIEQNYVRN
jgi:hypothetical protein